jgi:prepilin-type N-terminal cleavage/methylation domain-containing protein
VDGQRGYTLVEILVATAIAFVIGSVALRLVHATAFAAAHADARLNARGAADRLGERLIADAASAWSVFVPPADVLGKSNADGHEIDFVSEDAAHREYWWAYGFDAATSRVTKYAYVPGSPPAAGDTFDGITGLDARTHPITDLGDAASDAYDPLFASDSLSAVDVPFTWGGTAIGGNHLARVTISALGVRKVLNLSSGTAPSHFTVVVDYTPPP